MKCVALESPTHQESWTCHQTRSNFSIATHYSQSISDLDRRPSVGIDEKNFWLGKKFEVVAKPQTIK